MRCLLRGLGGLRCGLRLVALVLVEEALELVHGGGSCEWLLCEMLM